MSRRQTCPEHSRRALLPRLWLVTDARNDAVLERTIARLPRGSGVIFRHYHLDAVERQARFREVARLARAKGHLIVLSGDARTARYWGADGAYGPRSLLARGPALPRLVTAHSLRELRRAGRADAVVLSPVFATRSHPGARPLGPLRFHLLAGRSPVPVIALGGVDARRARAFHIEFWAAIDGLSQDS